MFKTEKDNKVSIKIMLPENVQNIRFDPDDCGRVALKNLKIYLDGAEQKKYNTIGGNTIDGMICFGSMDPQIIIPLEEKGVKELKIEFECADLYNYIGKVIEKLETENNYLKQKVNYLNAVLQEIYTSSSWKVARGLRKVGRIFKK